jgi:hypothetical protein
MTAKLDGTNGLLQNYDYQVLTTAFSYTFAAGTQILVINPAGTLATGTITMPAAPADGMTITFSSTRTITALTVNANTGQSIVSAPTVLPANQVGAYVYRLSNTTWYPFETVPTNVPVTPAGGSIITSGTAVASTSGTSIDFTSLPAWVEKITVMFDAVSTSSTSNWLIQLGDSGGIENTGYLSVGTFLGASTGGTNYTTGFGLPVSNASHVLHGSLTVCNLTGNVWVASGGFAGSGTAAGFIYSNAGSKTLSATLDRVRITTVNGTDTFDAGTINILYE